jgi:hypothetical protein
MHILKRAILGAGLLLAAIASANAAPILQGTATSLTGINGLIVGGNTYNATFVDGSCASVYGVCDSAHFTFTTAAGAIDASNAILAAIAGTYFDTNSGTVGCPSGVACIMITPYALEPVVLTVDNVLAVNSFSGSDFVQVSGFDIAIGTSGNSTTVWTVYSAVTAVPEPVTLSLFGAGVGGMASIRRKRKKAA